MARGLNKFVELENYLDYRNNLTFCEAYQKRTIRAGYDWRWVKGYEDYMIKRGGLSVLMAGTYITMMIID